MARDVAALGHGVAVQAQQGHALGQVAALAQEQHLFAHDGRVPVATPVDAPGP